MFNKELIFLILVRFPEKLNDSERGALYFAQPKPDANQVHFLRDITNLNNQLKCKYYPMPKIN